MCCLDWSGIRNHTPHPLPWKVVPRLISARLRKWSFSHEDHPQKMRKGPVWISQPHRLMSDPTRQPRYLQIHIHHRRGFDKGWNLSAPQPLRKSAYAKLPGTHCSKLNRLQNKPGGIGQVSDYPSRQRSESKSWVPLPLPKPKDSHWRH